MSAAFHLKIEQTKAFLFQGQLAMAQGILNELETENSVQTRWKDHYLGIIKMRQGSFDEAIDLFLNTLSKNGHYLSVILDLASCYYMTGQMYNWQRMVELASYEYTNNSEKLALSRRIQSCVLLTKYLEEKGLIFESLEQYQNLLELIPDTDQKHKSTPEYIRISAQILRLHGQYGLKNTVAEIYQNICQHHNADINMDCDFEIQHALMIYELQYLDAETALVRYQRILANPLAQSFEVQWVQVDLLFGLISRGYSSQALKIKNEITGELNPFTQALFRLLDEKNLSLEYYMDCMTQMTPAAQLRLLKVWALFSENPLPLKRQKLLTDLFSKKTKAAWVSYFKVQKISQPTTQVTIRIDASLSRLEVASSDQDLYVSQSVLEIFQLFIGQQNITITDVCQKLWSSDGSESDISRLRMRVSRLNEFLQSNLGIKGAFKIGKIYLKTSLLILKK